MQSRAASRTAYTGPDAEPDLEQDQEPRPDIKRELARIHEQLEFRAEEHAQLHRELCSYLELKSPQKGFLDDQRQGEAAYYYQDSSGVTPLLLEMRINEIADEEEEIPHEGKLVATALEDTRRKLAGLTGSLGERSKARFDAATAENVTSFKEKIAHLRGLLDLALDREQALASKIQDCELLNDQLSQKIDTLTQAAANPAAVLKLLFRFSKEEIAAALRQFNQKQPQRERELKESGGAFNLQQILDEVGFRDERILAKFAEKEAEYNTEKEKLLARAEKAELECDMRDERWRRAMEDVVRLKQTVKALRKANLLQNELKVPRIGTQSATGLSETEIAALTASAPPVDCECQTDEEWAPLERKQTAQDLTENVVDEDEDFDPAPAISEEPPAPEMRRSSVWQDESVVSNVQLEDEETWWPSDDYVPRYEEQGKLLGLLRFVLLRYAAGLLHMTKVPVKPTEIGTPCVDLDRLRKVAPGLANFRDEITAMESSVTAIKEWMLTLRGKLSKLYSQVQALADTKQVHETVLATVRDVKQQLREIKQQYDTYEEKQFKTCEKMEHALLEQHAQLQAIHEDRKRRFQNTLMEDALQALRKTGSLARPAVKAACKEEQIIKRLNAINNWAILYVKQSFFVQYDKGTIGLLDLQQFPGDRMVMMQRLTRNKWQLRRQQLVQRRKDNLMRLMGGADPTAEAEVPQRSSAPPPILVDPVSSPPKQSPFANLVRSLPERTAPAEGPLPSTGSGSSSSAARRSSAERLPRLPSRQDRSSSKSRAGSHLSMF
eukprot:TRINITY_DN7538_c0_g1_i1.p1 TRINITY_DN7538_c0_g1~~TRINITY_DN7538_c0_g1_i1.p1  ORF type:complete len:780 (+),score=134.55 TRINITY_DN7538_c0_g1_i1:33-2372(+)